MPRRKTKPGRCACGRPAGLYRYLRDAGGERRPACRACLYRIGKYGTTELPPRRHEGKRQEMLSLRARGVGLRRLSRMFGIPKSTIQDLLSHESRRTTRQRSRAS